ncbi:uncharacterized protein V1510DRAFT_423049 [Dipodascopsis tothii]|uniref:uncharacterized protein n=1 Tax=Dipodascopsis tothii TaxID=44089 RepID=UPI0034CEFC19
MQGNRRRLAFFCRPTDSTATAGQLLAAMEVDPGNPDNLSAADFTVVRSKKNRRKRNNKLVYQEKTPEDHAQDIAKKQTILEPSRFATKMLASVAATIGGQKISSLRCLALGRPSEIDISRFQMAILFLLADRLDVPRSGITLWDPDFVEGDLAVFARLDLAVVKDIDLDPASTLFYVPHGPIFLMDQLMSISARWILGNDIIQYENKLAEDVNTKYPSLKHAIALARANDADLPAGPAEVWARERFDDALSTNTAWWLSVNDLAMHWRRR